MSVQQALTCVIKRLHVRILMAVTLVHVTVDTLEMGKFAMVNKSVHKLISFCVLTNEMNM